MKMLFKISAIIGTALLTIGLAATYIDARVDFIGDRYSAVVLEAILGVLLSFIGFVGWAAQVNRKTRILMAVLVFLYPLLAICIGIPIVGETAPGVLIHIVGALFLPAFVLAVALIAMAGTARA
jgi:hypothetical protein